MRSSLRSTAIPAALVTSLVLAAQCANAAQVDYFLKIDGIDGESFDSKHKGEIQIESWSWGVTQTSIGNGNRAPTRGCATSINFSKLVDKSTPTLMANAVSGKGSATAVLIGRKAGETQQEFLKIELSNILVSSYSAGGSGDGVPLDAFALNFANATIEYKVQKPDGATGDTVKASFQGGC